MKSTGVLSLIGVVLCLGACAPVAEEPVQEVDKTEADKRAIKSVSEQWRTYREEATRRELFEKLKPVRLKHCGMKRFGAKMDGGYLLCGYLLEEVQVAYSYGIGGRDSSSVTSFL